MVFNAGERLLSPTLEARIAALESHPAAEIRRLASLPVTSVTTYSVVPLDNDGSGARDPFGMWASSTPSRIVIPAGLDGRWNFRADIQWPFNAAGFRGACFTKNAGNPNTATADRLGQDSRMGSTLTETRTAPEWEDNFVAGEYVQLWVNQNSGGTLDPVSNGGFVAAGIRVYARRLGPVM